MKGVGHEEGVAMGQREGVAMGARGPRAAKSALGLRALVSSHVQRCRHNLAHDSSHDPAHDPARDPARDPPKGGWAVWRWPCGGHMTCHVTWQDNPLRVTHSVISAEVHRSGGNWRFPFIIISLKNLYIQFFFIAVF